MVLNAHTLTLLQRCPRRLRIESLYRYRRPQPVSLFSRLMRTAIFELSNGADADALTQSTVNAYLDVARAPGLDVLNGTDVYTLAMDLCACVRTILHYLSRCPLLPTSRPGPVEISPGIQWQTLSTMDESGTLHRWRFVDYIDNSTLHAELHSWYVAGDVMALRTPMTVHFISLGQIRSAPGGKTPTPGRRTTPWCKGYRDGSNFNRIRFSRINNDGRRIGPADDWTPVFVSDLLNNSKQPDLVSNWVDSMLAAETIDKTLIRHIHVEIPAQPHLIDFPNQLMAEAERYICLPEDPFRIPLYRPACDSPTPCPHQDACYLTDFDFVRSGLYDKIRPGGSTNLTKGSET